MDGAARDDSVVNQIFCLLEFSNNILELCYEKHRQAQTRIAELETENKLLKLSQKIVNESALTCPQCQRQFSTRDGGNDFLEHVRQCFPCTQLN